MSPAEKTRLAGFLERGYSAPRIAEMMGISLSTAKRWRLRWQEKRKLPFDTRPALPPPLVEVSVPRPKLPSRLPPSMIEPLPLSRLMAGR